MKQIEYPENEPNNYEVLEEITSRRNFALKAALPSIH
jgi:hypothetical protein